MATPTKDLIVKNFQELVNFYKVSKNPTDKFRAKTYQLVIKNIQAFPGSGLNGDITMNDLDEISKISGIGEKSIAKIKEILETHSTLEKVKKIKGGLFLEEQKRIQVITDFKKILGVGQKTAERWYNKGYKNHSDILREGTALTEEQLYGIVYFDDLQKTIPRIEMCFYEVAVKHILKPYGIQVLLGGSYRRGSKTSGDIDFIVEKNHNTPQQVIDLLTDNKIIHRNIAFGQQKYRGLARLEYKPFVEFVKKLKLEKEYGNLPVRRIDIQFTTLEKWPFALLYFGSSDDFNRKIRAQAKKLGYKLSEHGLEKNGKNIKVKSEREIFDILGLDYILAEKR